MANACTTPSAPAPADTELDAVVVGRASELQTLSEAWRRASAGQRQVVFVIGEPGMGKTTLTDAFVRRLAVGDSGSAPSLIAHGSARAARAASCFAGDRGVGAAWCSVRQWSGPDCGATPPVASPELPGARSPTNARPLERRLGFTNRERMLREMATLVAALPAPLVLILEDLHWSDHATLDVITTLAQRRDPARLLLIGTYRPVDVAVRSHPLRTVHQDLRAHGRCQDLWVTPLKERDVTDFLLARWPRLADAASLARPLHERTDGNPLFLTSMADYLAADGAVVEVDGVWRLQRDPAALAAGVPPGLHQLIAAHIDRLDDDDRTVPEAGAWIAEIPPAAFVGGGARR